jgi:lipopolysaccharide/colanic/teichoic acid biosynthesis glycosyltransferase
VTTQPESNFSILLKQMYEALKRLFDFIMAALGIIVTGPLLILTSIAIKLDSTGPVLYLGERVGLHGRKFRICKFRTMCIGAEARGTTTAADDPRVTRVGRVIREYKVDELPQLFNVLKGEMSLVGPRPEVEEHTNAYDDEEKLILTVMPGITDYSSIHFFRLNEILGSEDPHQLFINKYRAEKNALRLKYVRNRSVVEDLRILMATFLAIARAALEHGEPK